jgi:PAS domain S-box-containing protein
MVSKSSKLNTSVKIKDKFPFNLVIIFLILSIGVILFGYYYYISLRDSYFSQEESDIRFQSDLKSKLIETWLDERIKHANSIPKNKLRVSEINSFLNNPESQSQKDDLSEWMELLLEQYGYKHAVLYDKNLKPLISVPMNTNIDADSETERIRHFTPFSGAGFSGLYLNNSDSTIHMNIFVNIQSAENKEKPGAVLIFDIDLQTYLLPTLLQIPSEHQTMESLVAQKEGDHILFLNELKFKQQTALKFKIPLTDTSIIAVKAALGKEGITYGKDYMDKDVIACINKIRGTPWFIITKVDMHEINGPILERSVAIVINVLIGIIITGVIIVLIWRNQRAKHYRILLEKESEKKAMSEHYAYLSKFANDIILLYDENLNIVEANDKAVECYKYTKDELLGLNVKDIRAPGHTDNISKVVKEVNDSGGAIFETWHVRKDGSTFPVEISTRAINIDGKKFYQSIVRDISERKKSEELLKKNEILTSAVIDNSPVGITLRANNGDLISYNQAWQKLWGLTPEKVLELEEYSRKLPLEERFRILGKDAAKALYTIKTGKHQFIPEIRIDNPYNNKILWVSMYLYAIIWEGKIERIVTITQDITDRKTAEENLNSSEEHHRTIIEHSTILFYTHDTNHKITYLSPQVRDFLDCEPEEALINWLNFTTDNPVNELGYYLTKKAIETATPQPPYELELLTKKGRIIWVEVHESPVIDNGKTVAIAGSLTDITARKKAEEKVIKLNRFYRVLSEVNQLIVRTKDEKELFDQICKILVEIGNFKMVWVAELDTEFSSIKPIAVKGYDLGYVDILVSHSSEVLSKNEPLYQSLSEKKVIVFNNLEDDLKRSWRKESIKREYGSYCIIPLKQSKRNLILNLYASERDFFSKDEIDIITELAADISFSLYTQEQENLKTEAEAALKKSTEQLQMLYETSKELNRTLNLEDAYGVILEFVSKFMDCEVLVVSRYNSKEQKIYYSYVWVQGVKTEIGDIPPIDLAPEGKGILSRVIRSGNPLIIDDYEAELEKSQTKFRVDEKGRTYDINSGRKDNTRSALLVPLKIEGEVIGVLHITSFKKNAYTEENMRLLESISVHISSTINNATLYNLATDEITERKKTEEELRKSEERFSLAFKLSPIPISLTKLSDGTFIDINDAFVKLLGFTYEDVKGLKTTDVNIWDKELREKTLSKLKTIGLLRDLELKIRNKEGKEFNTITTIQIINIGGEDCIISMVQDITEKKKAEEQLRKLSRAVEQSSASIIITDLKGDIEYVNPKFSEMSGYEAQEAIGKNPSILKSGKNPEELYVDLWKTISSGREWHGELQNKRKDGEFYWEWASISPIFDSKGTITNYLAVKEDITVHKLIQDQIRLQAILLENITDAVISVNHNFVIKSWNSGAEKMYGWKANEVVGKNLKDFLKTQFINDSLSGVLKYINKHNTWLGEVLQTTKNGKKISVLDSTSTLRDERGAISGYVSVNRDITERKQHEEKLKTSLKEKEILLKEIHHRVKNNLQVISSLLKMQSAYIKDPLALEYFKISSQRVKSMALIHEQLYRSVDLSKIDFENYIKKLSTHLYQTYGVSSSKVRFIVKVNDIMLEIDTAIPCGLLVNELISNSLKHGFPENKTGKIEVEMERTANKYVLKVSDTGNGFPENIDFQNTETLGMQLVNTLVEQIEGTIELKNDSGTEFTITFKAHEYKKRI